MVSVAGDPVIEPPLVGYFDLPGRSSNGGWTLGMSGGGASLLGVLGGIEAICRWDLEC